MRKAWRDHWIAARWAAYVRVLQRSSRPILCGPWRSEVGFEILYWLPFLVHLREKHGIARDRLIVIGRGGSASWYDAAGAADLYEFMPVDAVRTLTIQASQQTGTVNQYTTGAWERHVCALAAAAVGVRSYHVVSPSWMYGLVRPFWEGRRSESWLARHVLQPVRLRPAPATLDLPKDFIAMRWYTRATWPHNEKLLTWTRGLVTRLAARRPVVLMDAGLRVDDHGDIALGEIPNVTRLSDYAALTPLNNLAVQSAAVARAGLFVGTYGGMAQAAFRFGVPTVALWDTFQQTMPAHLLYTQALSLQTGVPFWGGTPEQMASLGILG